MLLLRNCFKFSKQVDRRQILEQYETKLDRQPTLFNQIYLLHRAKLYTTAIIGVVSYHYYNLYKVAGTELIVKEDEELMLSKKVITLLKWDFQECQNDLVDFKLKKFNSEIQKLLGQGFKIVVLNTSIPIFKVFSGRNMIISQTLIQELEENQLLSLFLYEYSQLSLRSNAVNLSPNQLHYMAINRMFNYTTYNFFYGLFQLNQFSKQYFFQQYRAEQIELSLNFVTNSGYDGEFLKKLFANNSDEGHHSYSMFEQNRNVRALLG